MRKYDYDTAMLADLDRVFRPHLKTYRRLIVYLSDGAQVGTWYAPDNRAGIEALILRADDVGTQLCELGELAGMRITRVVR